MLTYGSCQFLVASWLAQITTADHQVKTADGRLGPAVTHLGLRLATWLEEADRQGNFVLSPYSAHSALSQLSLGARGQTAAELEQLLGLSAVDSSWLHSNWTAGEQEGLPPAFGVQDDPSLRVCNLIAVAEGFMPLSNYTRALETRFKSQLQQFDFADNMVGSVRAINSHVEKETGGQIAQLLQPSALGTNTRLVLINALHFRALWQQRFDSRYNFVDIFTKSDGRQVRTSFMSASLLVSVRRDRLRQLTMLELPYNDGATSLLIILPFKSSRDSQDKNDRQDKNDSIMQRLLKFRLDKQGHTVRVLVQLPRFRIRHRTDLRTVLLRAANISSVFSPRLADLSGISAAAQPPLFVSDALQEAAVEVNEEGTEAAAATAVVKAARSGPFWFTANRPFVFVVYDRRLGGPLFMGKVEDPSL